MFPHPSKIFESLTLCTPSKVKVVILATEPYRNLKSTGVAFETTDNSYSPSLRNIAKEIQREFLGHSPRLDLRSWLRQGVLLINASFGVSQSLKDAGRDAKVWRPLINNLLSYLSRRKKIVFMLWGNAAISRSPYIESKDNLILIAGHPSPRNRNRQSWENNEHFIKANEFLRLKGKRPIIW